MTPTLTAAAAVPPLLLLRPCFAAAMLPNPPTASPRHQALKRQHSDSAGASSADLECDGMCDECEPPLKRCCKASATSLAVLPPPKLVLPGEQGFLADDADALLLSSAAAATTGGAASGSTAVSTGMSGGPVPSNWPGGFTPRVRKGEACACPW